MQRVSTADGIVEGWRKAGLEMPATTVGWL
jgi:hypothetical protein